MTKRLLLLGEALVTGVAVAVAAAATIGLRPGWPLVVVVALSVIVGGAPLRLAVAGPSAGDSTEHTGSADDSVDSPTAPAPVVGVVVRAGGEPAEVLEATVALATATGPTVVVVAGDRALDEAALGVSVVREATIGAAVQRAASEFAADVTAVAVVSGRAAPAADACKNAARRLVDDVGWVCGTAATASADAYLDDRAARVAERLRLRARRRGLQLWEPDATVVRVDLLAGAPLPVGRPWGRWLRDRAADGWRGLAVADALALRLAPSAERAYWPDTTARQRAAAADAGDAWRTRTASGGRARRAAIAVLADELVAWRTVITALALVPMLADRHGDWIVAPVTLTAAVSAVSVLRWVATCVCLGLRPRPVADALAVLHRVPGSLAALGPALTGRLRPLRVPVPTRPLTWVALLFTLVSGAQLVGRAADGATPVRPLLATLVSLGVVWAFAVRAFLRRNWERTTFRVPVDLAAWTDDRAGRVVDASPRGLALVIDGATTVAPGDRLVVHLPPPDGQPMTVTGTVAAVRRRGSGTLLGVGLELGPAERGRWLRLVLDAAEVATSSDAMGSGVVANTAALAAPAYDVGGLAVVPGAPRSRWSRWADRAAVAAGTAVSVAVLGLLVLVMSGYHTLVIRSGSMVPTFGVGDVVISQPRPASSIVEGDIVTVGRIDTDDDSLTHRVRSIRAEGDRLVITTRGDHNRNSETWSVARDQSVGRARWHVPWIGRPALALRDGRLGQAVMALGALVLAATLGRSFLGARHEVGSIG